MRPDQQGRGVGDILLRHAEDFARSLGFDETRLYTNVMFATNLAFYEKRGYSEYTRETLAPGAVAVHMRKPIGLI